MRFLGPELVLATTDLTKFVRCDHATFLDHGTKNGTITPLAYRPPSPMTELIARKGDEHEHAYVDGLRAAGKQVVTIQKAPWSLDALHHAEAETLAAMRSGANYIYQAAFFDGRWNGYADLLERVERPSPRLGAHSYEVVDTKPARSVRAHFILQLADYSHHLARLQGSAPEATHVVLGTNQRLSFRVSNSMRTSGTFEPPSSGSSVAAAGGSRIRSTSARCANGGRTARRSGTTPIICRSSRTSNGRR